MANWELAIAVKDENDNLCPACVLHTQGFNPPKIGETCKYCGGTGISGRRKKEGDIIAYKPAPWDWGKEESKTHLIVPVTGLTEEEVIKLCQSEYEYGILKEDVVEDLNGDLKDLGKWKSNTQYKGPWKELIDIDTIKTHSGSKIATVTHRFSCIHGGKSGMTEPKWKTNFGESTIDGTIVWRCDGERRIKGYDKTTNYKVGDIVDVEGVPMRVEVGGYVNSESNIVFDTTYKSENQDGQVKFKSLGKYEPRHTKKRRFCISLDIIKEGWDSNIDTKKVADKKDKYQPLKDKNIKIDFKEKVAICKDRHTGTFRYSKKKKVEKSGKQQKTSN